MNKELDFLKKQLINSIEELMKEKRKTLKSIVLRKLNGEVLNKRTGELYKSIRSNTFVNSKEIKIVLNTDCKYANIHEYGFNGLVSIMAHERKTKNGLVSVKAHSRFMKIPERSFLRTSLKEILPEIIKDLNKL